MSTSDIYTLSLHDAFPISLESALRKNSCQQRGVQSLQFECTFNLDDGPQSLIVVPEAGQKVPHKKAEIEMLAARSEEHTSELQSPYDLVCRLLLEKKNKTH